MDPNQILVNPDKLSGAELNQLFDQLMRKYFIEIAYSRAQRPGDLVVKTIDLEGSGGLYGTVSTMSELYPNGFKIDFPFKSVYVADASDAQAKIFLVPGTTQGQFNLGLAQNCIPLSLKDSHVQDAAASQGLLIWPSQPGKRITLVFSINSETRSGSSVQLVSGGVTVTNGSGIYTAPFGAPGTAPIFLVPAAATLVLPANSNRKVVRFRVAGGDIRIGDSSVSSTVGLLLEDGAYYEHRNTGTLHAYAVSGAPELTGTEEF